MVSINFGIVNALVELVVVLMSEFTRPINETVNYIDSINGIAWIQYVNLGFVLIFMSISIKFENQPYGFFDGIYE